MKSSIFQVLLSTVLFLSVTSAKIIDLDELYLDNTP